MEPLASAKRNLLSLLLWQLRKDLSGGGKRGRTHLCICDFGGAHRGALFNTYAFLELDVDDNAHWFVSQRAFRCDAFATRRRMSFKALNDRERRSALPSFLDGANSIDGALVVFAVAKDMDSLFATVEANEDRECLLAAWKPNVREHLLRVTHLSAAVISVATVPGQNLLWIADEDEIASNDRQLVALTQLVGRVFSNALTHDLGHLRVGTTRSDNGSLELEDLAAICDLAAGCTSEAVSAMKAKRLFPVRGIVNRLPSGLTDKTQFLLEWLSTKDCRLRKTVIVIDEPEGRRPRLTTLSFQHIPRLIG
jgi:hypothetical protein